MENYFRTWFNQANYLLWTQLHKNGPADALTCFTRLQLQLFIDAIDPDLVTFRGPFGGEFVVIYWYNDRPIGGPKLRISGNVTSESIGPHKLNLKKPMHKLEVAEERATLNTIYVPARTIIKPTYPPKLVAGRVEVNLKTIAKQVDGVRFLMEKQDYMRLKKEWGLTLL